MRDTSHNLVINKQTPHPIKHLTSPCSSRITYAAWAHVEGISKSAKGVLYISPGLGQGRPPPRTPCLHLLHLSVCLSVCGLMRASPRHERHSAALTLRFHLSLPGPDHSTASLYPPTRRVCQGFCKHVHLLWKTAWMRWSYWLSELRGCCWGERGGGSEY